MLGFMRDEGLDEAQSRMIEIWLYLVNTEARILNVTLILSD